MSGMVKVMRLLIILKVDMGSGLESEHGQK